MSEEQNEQLPLDRKDLKIQALLEKISDQNNQIADCRVDITILSQANQQLVEKVNEWEKSAQAHAVSKEAEPTDKDSD